MERTTLATETRKTTPFSRVGPIAACLAFGVAVLLAPRVAQAQADRIYFPAVDNVTSVLVSHINAETVRVDMSAWYLTEHAISIALAGAFHRGVQIRLIGDRGSIFEIDPATKHEFYWLASQGIPIRLRYYPTWYPEITHWKTAIFKGQGLVAFGSANYTPFQLAPASPTNYSDETVLVSSDPALVNAFLTKFDVMWNDTTTEANSIIAGPPYLSNWNSACALESACADYLTLYPTPAPMTVNTARLEANYPMPADLLWGQGPEFNNRVVQEINAETASLRFVIYRLTVDNVTQALINRFQAGVPTRLIVEPSEYLNRKWPEFWLTHANIDKLWAAGVPIKQRRHAGLTHMKMLVTSRYATNASSNLAAAWQRDTDYFVSAAGKPSIYQAMANRFEIMWNDAEGFADFVPQPPAAPMLSAPAGGSAGVSTAPTLRWNAAPFATSYDVYLGRSPADFWLAGTVPAQLVNDPPATYSWMSPSPLAGGVIYYWKVVAKTNATVRDASLVATSGTWTFVTTGNTAWLSPPGDYDGDGISDLALWRPAIGAWHVVKSRDGSGQSTQWGLPGDLPVPADYDGDGRVDLAVWRPSTGDWWILYSGTGYTTYMSRRWGVSGDVPVPGDYDGDGRADLAVWRPSAGEWWVLRSGSGYLAHTTVAFGAPGDVPVPADYDGDRATDPAVWRPSTGTWWMLQSNTGYATFRSLAFGSRGDVPVPGHYDTDGLADLAIWRPTTGTWWLLKSSNGYATSTMKAWGVAGDVPIAVDWDGDGLSELGLWRPSARAWWMLYSSSGYTTASYRIWGLSGDRPAY